MDDIDAFFGEEACDEFVKGINLDYMMDEAAEEGKRDFAQAFLDQEDVLLASVLGQTYESLIKNGLFNHLTR